VSLAFFRGPVLDSCVDVTAVPEPGATEDLSGRLNGFASELGPAKGFDKIPLGKPCAEQFPDRVVLADCVIEQSYALARLVIAEHHFNADTVGYSDAYAKECLASHGDWHPNTHTDAVARELARQRIGNLQRYASDGDGD
jgi:hypothetical protein